MISLSKLAATVIVSFLCIILPACREPEPVRIGFIGGLSGRAAGLGVSGRNGFLLAIEVVNAAGGVQGRRIEPVIGDDHMDPKAAVITLRELLDRKVVAIIGPMTSQIAVSVVPEANRARVPMISPTVSTNQLSGLDDYFLRVYYSNAQAAAMLADFLSRHRQRPRMLAIYDQSNRAYTEDWLNDFSRHYHQLGGQLIASIPFETGAGVSFGALTDQALAEKPEGILLLANAVDTAMIAQQLAKRATKIPLYATGWSYTDDLLQFGGKSVEGLTIIQSANQESLTPEFQTFHKKYKELFHDPPNFPALHAYEATRVTLAALAKVGEDGTNLKQALLALPSTSGAQGTIAFDRFGDLRDPYLHLATIQNGTYRSLR